tara:strand:+ start:379 stop:564 length:186 start_codon:yes stop_codon:yes gene_type:complete
VYYKKKLKMNFKERGVTVGDLIIIIAVILFSFFIINNLKESKNKKQITTIYQLEIINNISK